MHNCTHANKALANKPEAQQLEEMCAHCLNLVKVLQPRSLLMLAVDGVAPTAKIAQQRTRRYTSALRQVETARHRASAIRELASERCGPQGGALLVAALEDATKDSFDSNIITQGTPFMARMEAALHAFLVDQLATNPLFAELEVVWSPSSDPGEGEHKVLNYLRRRRCLPGYAPNATRVIVGQDADLLLLALATHEPRALVLREQFVPAGEKGDDADDTVLQVISIPALREALQWEFAGLVGGEPDDGNDSDSGRDVGTDGDADARPASSSAAANANKQRGCDLERIIDDVVVLSCLLGNDFLPPVPSLDILERPSGLEAVWEAYRKSVARHGYITHKGEVVDPQKGLRGLLRMLAEGELARLQHSAQQLERRTRGAARRLAAKAQAEADEDADDLLDVGYWDTLGEVNVGSASRSRVVKELQPTCDAAQLISSPDAMAVLVEDLKRRVVERVEAAYAPATTDALLLGTPGDAGRYYRHHFPDCFQNKAANEAAGLAAASATVAQHWLEGLGWVAAYYFAGAGADNGAPWRWAYAHHEAPLLRDMVDHAEAARGLLPKAATERGIAALQSSSDLSRSGTAPMSAAERRRLRAQRKAKARGEAVAQVDEEAAELLAEWDACQDGPVVVQLQLLAVIPPESAPACYPPECLRVLRAVGSETESATMARLSKMFPTAHETCAAVQRGRRFSWQAAVRIQPVCFAFAAAALDEVGSGEEGDEPPALVTTVLMVNHVRHPEAAFLLASILGGCREAQSEPAAGGAAWLAHAAWDARDSPHEHVVCVPLDMHATAPPFGGGLADGARLPAKQVTSAMWRDARSGLSCVPRIHNKRGGSRAPAASVTAQGASFWPPDFDPSAYLSRVPPSLLS